VINTAGQHRDRDSFRDQRAAVRGGVDAVSPRLAKGNSALGA
jgi:hypothetical protein